MGQNNLFNYIHNHLRDRPQGCTQISLKTDKANTSYYLLELPKKEITLVDANGNTYTLLKHHVSAYANELKPNPFLSQYHYTGFFLDQNSKTCQLHVYFNGDDIPAFTNRNLNFSRQQGGAKISADLDDQLMSLVYSVIALPMADLRKGLAAKVKSLENDYLRLEQQASELSENQTLEGIKQYRQALVKLEKTLHQLIPLVSHLEYKKIQALISSLIQSIDKLTDKLTPEPQLQISSKSKKKTPQKRVSPPKPLPKPVQNDEQDNNLDTLKGLSVKFLNVCQQNLATQASAFAFLRSEVFGFAAQLPQNTPLSLLKELKKLQGEIEKKGKNLLEGLLAANQFELAKQLTPFHYILTHDSLIKALQENKPALLDFILTHGEINVDQPFTLGNTFYQSAAEYCFIHYPRDPICLTLLVRHGCSLMIKDKQGLPLAYTLTDPQHLLYTVLAVNPAQTIGSLTFCKKLIATLQLYLRENQKQSNVVNLVPIQEKIIQLQEELQTMQLHNRLSTVNQIKLESAVSQLIEDTGSEVINLPLMQRLQNDPEILDLFHRLSIISNQHMQGLSTTALNKEIKSTAEHINQFNDNSVFNKLFTDEVQELLKNEEHYSAIKAFLIRELNIDIQLEELKIKKSYSSLKQIKNIVLEENQLVLAREKSQRELASAINSNPLLQAINSMETLGNNTVKFAKDFQVFAQALSKQFDNLNPDQLAEIGQKLENIGTILEGTSAAMVPILDENYDSSAEYTPELAQETLVFSVPNSPTFFPSENQLKSLKPSSELAEDQSPQGPPQ